MIRLAWAIETLEKAIAWTEYYESDCPKQDPDYGPIGADYSATELIQQVIAELQGEQAFYRAKAERDNDDLFGDYRRGKG